MLAKLTYVNYYLMA